MTKISPLKIDTEKTFKFSDKNHLSVRKKQKKKVKKKTRTAHSSLYAQSSKMPEMINIIVTEREIGAMRRKMEKQYKRIIPEIELEAIVRAEKMTRIQRK